MHQLPGEDVGVKMSVPQQSAQAEKSLCASRHIWVGVPYFPGRGAGQNSLMPRWGCPGRDVLVELPAGMSQCLGRGTQAGIPRCSCRDTKAGMRRCPGKRARAGMPCYRGKDAGAGMPCTPARIASLITPLAGRGSGALTEQGEAADSAAGQLRGVEQVVPAVGVGGRQSSGPAVAAGAASSLFAAQPGDRQVAHLPGAAPHDQRPGAGPQQQDEEEEEEGEEEEQPPAPQPRQQQRSAAPLDLHSAAGPAAAAAPYSAAAPPGEALPGPGGRDFTPRRPHGQPRLHPGLRRRGPLCSAPGRWRPRSAPAAGAERRGLGANWESRDGYNCNRPPGRGLWSRGSRDLLQDTMNTRCSKGNFTCT